MKTYAIMREPGAVARRERESRERRFSVLLPTPRPRRMAVVQGEGVVDALAEYVFQTYLRTWHLQYAGYRIEYKHRGKWVTWTEKVDPHDRRDYRLVVTLRNGRRTHETILYAWLQS